MIYAQLKTVPRWHMPLTPAMFLSISLAGGALLAGQKEWAMGLMVVVPLALLTLPLHHFVAGLAVVSHLAGVAASRWLFFAEAEHVVGLYYGKR